MTVKVKAPKGSINIPVPGEKPLHLKDGDDVPEHLCQRAIREGWGEAPPAKKVEAKRAKKEGDD